jgi:uncharacterized protein (TIGR03437 family)
MSSKRFSKLLLVVLALALWAGTANAQAVLSSKSTVAFTYVQGGGSNAVTTTSNITEGTDATGYVASVVYAQGTNWLTLTSVTGTYPNFVAGTTADALTIAMSAGSAATMAPGTYNATISLTPVSDTAATIAVQIVITSPLSAATPTNLALTFVKGGGSSQAAASTTSVVSNTDASYDTYTTVAAVGCPTWLDVTSAGSHQARASTTDTLTFAIDSTAAASASPASVTTCNVQLQFNAGTFKTVTFTSLSIVAQPLLATAPTASLSYNKGSESGTTSTSTTVKVAPATSSTPFNLDVATLPPWLTVTGGLTNNAANATVAGNTVTFGLVTAVAGGMATGNYSAQIGFYVATYGDMYVTISLQISNATPSLTVLPGTSPTNISFTSSMATPTPTATLYSTDEPVPFTATCTVAHSATSYVAGGGFATPCLLNGGTNVVNGTAFTWGYEMTAALDPVLFAATIGNTVTVTFTFTGVSSPPAPVVYVYTLQPGIPSITGVGPTSASANFSHTDSLVVLVKGTNFIGPGSITGSSIVPTQVWVGSPAVLLTALNAGTAGSYVVLNATQLMVTIPGTVFPAVAAGKTGTIPIGVANQTGALAPTVATATANLNITNSPVIYAMTSTASYVQPAIGSNPALAPYELISIFGDNFGLTGSASASAVFDAFGKAVTPMTLVAASGKTAATTLAVTFTSGKNSYTAPVLYSNQNQINAIVPSSLAAGSTYTVTVTAAGLASDGLFAVNAVAADPGIFTLASDGTGAGAIINQDGTINGSGHVVHASDTISIYLTGLGVPDSTGVDAAPSGAANFPGTCVQISNAGAGTPGLLQVVNLKVTGSGAYTPPSPAWTTIDGAVMNYGAHDIIAGVSPDLNYPPCMATATITVTFGPANNQLAAASVAYAGFVSGSVAGLYQINAVLPSSLVGSGSTSLSGAGAVPVSVQIVTTTPATFNSQPGVTVVF